MELWLIRRTWRWGSVVVNYHLNWSLWDWRALLWLYHVYGAICLRQQRALVILLQSSMNFPVISSNCKMIVFKLKGSDGNLAKLANTTQRWECGAFTLKIKFYRQMDNYIILVVCNLHSKLAPVIRVGSPCLGSQYCWTQLSTGSLHSISCCSED